MSKWVGSVTPSSINLVRVGGGRVGALLIPVAAIAALVAVLIYADTALTILAIIALVAGAAIPIWDVLAELHANRIERRWRAQVYGSAPQTLRVTSERVDELEPAVPVITAHVVDEREVQR